MTDIERLAARCEAADGGDRGLDEAIYEALGFCNHKRTEYYCIEDGNDTDSGYTCLDCGRDTYGAKKAPPYSTSLDAAMTLVPEGWDWTLESCSGAEKHGASIMQDPGPYIAIRAHTPALALCAAALRARAVEANDGQ